MTKTKTQKKREEAQKKQEAAMLQQVLFRDRIINEAMEKLSKVLDRERNHRIFSEAQLLFGEVFDSGLNSHPCPAVASE